MELDISIKLDLSRVLKQDGVISEIADAAIQAGMFKVEKAYVDEAPSNMGGFKQGIEVHKNGPLDYVVRSTAKSKGKNYPLFLFTGTGKMRGKPDFGYTPGRMRIGDIASGIGGIRPNKAALRAKKKIEKEFMSFVSSKIKQQLNK